MADDRSATATRRWLWPKSTPSAAPAELSNESRIGGRPPCSPCASPCSARSTTRPSDWSSETRLETVERERPVRRAISARLILPCWRSALITRRRLSRRNDASEPSDRSLTVGILTRAAGFCQGLERTFTETPQTTFELRTNRLRRERRRHRRGRRCRADRD